MALLAFDPHTPITRTVRGHLSLGPFSIAVKTSEVPRTGEGLYREAPPFLPMTLKQLDASLFLERLRMGGQCFAEYFGVALVHDNRSRVHPGRHRRSWRCPPILEFMHGVVVQVIGKLNRVVGHNVRLLRHCRGNCVSV